MKSEFLAFIVFINSYTNNDDRFQILVQDYSITDSLPAILFEETKAIGTVPMVHGSFPQSF
jgi:hypothetical protein